MSLTYGLGEGLDVCNILSDEGEFSWLLKKSGVMPDNFRMDKNIVDTVISSVGLIASVATGGLAGRATKMERLTEVIARLGGKMSDAIKGLKMIIKGLGEKGKEIFVALGDYIPDLLRPFKKTEKLNFDSIETIFKGIDEIPDGGTPPRKLVEAIAGLSDDERIQVAEKLLGKNVSASLREKLLAVHNANEAEVFKHSITDLKGKLLESENQDLIGDGADQISKEQRKVLMDYGVLGRLTDLTKALESDNYIDFTGASLEDIIRLAKEVGIQELTPRLKNFILDPGTMLSNRDLSKRIGLWLAFPDNIKLTKDNLLSMCPKEGAIDGWGSLIPHLIKNDLVQRVLDNSGILPEFKLRMLEESGEITKVQMQDITKANKNRASIRTILNGQGGPINSSATILDISNGVNGFSLVRFADGSFISSNSISVEISNGIPIYIVNGNRYNQQGVRLSR